MSISRADGAGGVQKLHLPTCLEWLCSFSWCLEGTGNPVRGTDCRLGVVLKSGCSDDIFGP